MAPGWVYAKTSFEADNPREKAELRGIEELVGLPTKQATRGLYNLLIREGIVPQVKNASIYMSHNHGNSVFHKLARAWHTVLMHQLKAVRLPESWVTAAAKVHKKLGGRGDLVEALPTSVAPGTDVNISNSLLQRKFLSYALQFLNYFVPKDIEKCVHQDSSAAVTCVAEYGQSLHSALVATLTAFFEAIAAQSPSSRVLSISFVFAVVSPCPFRFLIEPAFVYSVLAGFQFEFKPAESVWRVPEGKECPEFKKTLIHLLMTVGVTPGDIMGAKDLEKDFSKFSVTASEEVSEATKIDRNTLLKKNDTADRPSLDTASEVSAQLDAFLGAMPFGGRDKFFASRVGQKTKTRLGSGSSTASAEYLDRLRTILEDGNTSDIVPLSAMMEDLVKELSNTLGEMP